MLTTSVLGWQTDTPTGRLAAQAPSASEGIASLRHWIGDEQKMWQGDFSFYSSTHVPKHKGGHTKAPILERSWPRSPIVCVCVCVQESFARVGLNVGCCGRRCRAPSAGWWDIISHACCMKEGVEFQTEPLFTELPRVHVWTVAVHTRIIWGFFFNAAKFPNTRTAQEAWHWISYIFYSAENLHCSLRLFFNFCSAFDTVFLITLLTRRGVSKHC